MFKCRKHCPRFKSDSRLRKTDFLGEQSTFTDRTFTIPPMVPDFFLRQEGNRVFQHY